MWRGLCHVLWIELCGDGRTEMEGLKVESESRGKVGQLQRDDHTQLRGAVIPARK